MKAVLFDLDGTLLNTLGDIQFYVNQMLEHFSYPPISEEQARAYVGDGAEKLIERSLPLDAGNFEECFAYFSERFSASENRRTFLYEGELACLKTLKERGLKLAVVTNKPQRATEGCISRFFPEGFFDFVAGDSGMFPCKPDPSLALYAALSMRVPVMECAFVGDGETDVLTAKNAGMSGIAALWGYRTREQLEAAGAARFAAGYAELEKLLR